MFEREINPFAEIGRAVRNSIGTGRHVGDAVQYLNRLRYEQGFWGEGIERAKVCGHGLVGGTREKQLVREVKVHRNGSLILIFSQWDDENSHFRDLYVPVLPLWMPVRNPKSEYGYKHPDLRYRKRILKSLGVKQKWEELAHYDNSLMVAQTNIPGVAVTGRFGMDDIAFTAERMVSSVAARAA